MSTFPFPQVPVGNTLGAALIALAASCLSVLHSLIPSLTTLELTRTIGQPEWSSVPPDVPVLPRIRRRSEVPQDLGT